VSATTDSLTDAECATSPAGDEPGRPFGSRALDDAATAFDEITRFE
jgi:hypothetical protein